MYRSLLLLIACFGLTLWSEPTILAQELQEPELHIYINLWNNRLFLRNERGEVISEFAIAAGATDTPSPIGTFRVVHKSKNWGGGFGSRWLGLNVTWGTYGIHGTNRPESIGSFASHGCFRMKNRDIEKLYDKVSTGTTVIIDGPILGHDHLNYRILVPGSRGSLVQIVQNRLKAAGYYKGECHGKFNRTMEVAVLRFQKKEGLEVTGQIGFTDLCYLGIIE